MMQQQMCSPDQMGSPQQGVMLCPVRLIYETQILVQPGDQIQPNQTLFINSQNPPPWIQNQRQSQVIYMQQMPGNMMSSVPQPMDQSPMYVQNLQGVQGYYPQQMIQMDPRQMPNVVQMMPNIGQNVINVAQNVSNIGPNVQMVQNTGQNVMPMTNVVQNVQKPAGVNIAQNQNMASIVSNDRVYNNTNVMANTMPMAIQNTMNIQMQDRTVNMNQNLVNMQKVAELPGMRQNNLRQPQVTVSPMQNAKFNSNIADKIAPPNVGDTRPVNSPRPMTIISNMPNVMQANAFNKKLPLPNKPNPTVMANPVRHFNQTYYRHIQPKPLTVTPVPNPYLLAGTSNGPRPNQSDINRKRKSESPDETRKKIPTMAWPNNQPINVIETETGKTISYTPTSVRDFKLVERNVETASTGTQANIAKSTLNLQVVDMQPPPPNPTTLPQSKENLLVESEKLVRNTVFTQARGLLRSEPQMMQPDVIIRIEKLHSPTKVTPPEPMTFATPEEKTEPTITGRSMPNLEPLLTEAVKLNTEPVKIETLKPNIQPAQIDIVKPNARPANIESAKPNTEIVKIGTKSNTELAKMESLKPSIELLKLETTKPILEPKVIERPKQSSAPGVINTDLEKQKSTPIPSVLSTELEKQKPSSMLTLSNRELEIQKTNSITSVLNKELEIQKTDSMTSVFNKELEIQQPITYKLPPLPSPSKKDQKKIETRTRSKSPKIETSRTPEIKKGKQKTKIETITRAESKQKEEKSEARLKRGEHSRSLRASKEVKKSEKAKLLKETEIKPEKIETNEVNRKFTVTSINDFKGNELQIATGSVRKEDTDHYILTHVLDGYVIQESNTAFPIRKPLKEKMIYQNSDHLSSEPKKEETYKHRTEDGKLIKDNSKILSISDLNLNEDSTSETGMVICEDQTRTEEEMTKSEEDTAKSEKDKSEMIIEENEEKKVSESEQPFANVAASTVKSWTVDQLASHLSKYNWTDTIAAMTDHEIDGESLFLVNKQQLVQIGCCETHADIICDYVKNN